MKNYSKRKKQGARIRIHLEELEVYILVKIRKKISLNHPEIWKLNVLQNWLQNLVVKLAKPILSMIVQQGII